jgi:hypothetical protein
LASEAELNGRYERRSFVKSEELDPDFNSPRSSGGKDDARRAVRGFEKWCKSLIYFKFA